MSLDDTHGEENMSNIIANRGTVLYFIAVLLVIIFACGQTVSVLPMGQPSVSVLITANYCPSVAVQEGMQVAWTNHDSIDHNVILQCMNGAGGSMALCQSHRLQPGDTFALSLNDPGEYTYYCSSNQLTAGKITVLK